MVTSRELEGEAPAYANRPRGGRLSPGGDEVWLHGNIRPVLALGTFVIGAVAIALAGAIAGGVTAATPVLTAGLVILALVVVASARIAAGPRLGRRGATLLLRLSPWRTDAVPLTVVECVFPGSQPLDGPVLRHAHAEPRADQPPTRRVGTLVIRFAERAVAWRERPTFAPWGVWHDGHAIIDGRWCGPLSAEVAREIGQRLLEAKREAAAGEPAA